MHSNIKALYLVFMISFLSFAVPETIFAEETSANPQIEEIKKSQNKSSKMQTKRWNTPKKKEAEPEKDTKKDSKPEEAKEGEAELTQDQRIWNKYKDLADKNKDDDEDVDNETVDETTDEDTASADDTEATDVNPENAEEEPEKQPTGIAAVLQRYKKSQKSKGTLNTRSLGSVD